MNRHPALLACTAGLALLVALTGCSSLPTLNAPASSTAPGSGAAASPSTPSTASTTATLDKLCSLLSVESANAVVGVVFVTADDSVDPATGDRLCTYRSSDGAAVAVLRLVTPGRTTFEQLVARSSSPFPVEEVGDRASFDGDELDFQSGDRVFTVSSTGSSDLGIGNLTALGAATVSFLR